MAITVTRLHKDEHLSGGAALAMDSFDVLHLGQVQIIEDARVHALKIGAPLAVLSYEPSPFRLMNPHMGPLSIITRDQEIEFLSRIGVDILYILTFDFTIMRMSHSEFSRDILHNALGVRHISAPAWIAYGKDRLGRQGDLRSEGERYGFSVSAVDASPAADGAVISTHGIRDLISQGRMDEVVSQLGRPYAIKGSVQHGAKLGRTIGFPTANIALSDYVRPAAGIYASISQLQDGRRIPGLSYIGRRPTVDFGEERLEVFLFDFDADIYGQQLDTELIKFMRPDERFPNLEAMQVQMEADRRMGRLIALKALESGTLSL